MANMLALAHHPLVARSERDLAIAAALRAARERVGISQLEAGLAIGKNDQAIYRFETCRSAPNAADVATLCELYGVMPHVIMGWNPDESAMSPELREFLASREGATVTPVERAFLIGMPLKAGEAHTLDALHYYLLAIRKGRPIGDAAESALVQAEAKARAESRGWKALDDQDSSRKRRPRRGTR
jgi:transcriptional regulator with XRE-family HTH domain